MNTYEQQQAKEFHIENKRVLARAIKRIDGYLLLLRGREGTLFYEIRGGDDDRLAAMMLDVRDANARRNPGHTIEIIDGSDTVGTDALAEVLIAEGPL